MIFGSNYLETDLLFRYLMGTDDYHWKVVRVCAAVMTPFFQTTWRSLAYQFPTNAPLMCPQFQILEKKIAFSALFLAKISGLKRQISEFSLPRPLILQGKPA